MKGVAVLGMVAAPARGGLVLADISKLDSLFNGTCFIPYKYC